MPRFDKTGPEGKGPKTGRQMGKCKGAKPIAGRRLGLGRGLGRGRGASRGNQNQNSNQNA